MESFGEARHAQDCLTLVCAADLALFLFWIKHNSAVPFGVGRGIGSSFKDWFLGKSTTPIH
jgi:hypothetical protein